MAKTRPCKSRPTTKGVPSKCARFNSLGPTCSPGKARYQKPHSHCESGACFSGISLVLMRFWPAYHNGKPAIRGDDDQTMAPSGDDLSKPCFLCGKAANGSAQPGVHIFHRRA